MRKTSSLSPCHNHRHQQTQIQTTLLLIIKSNSPSATLIEFTISQTNALTTLYDTIGLDYNRLNTKAAEAVEAARLSNFKELLGCFEPIFLRGPLSLFRRFFWYAKIDADRVFKETNAELTAWRQERERLVIIVTDEGGKAGARDGADDDTGSGGQAAVKTLYEGLVRGDHVSR